jgi:hypothetical protein
MSNDLMLASPMGRAPELMTLNPHAPWSGDDLKCLPEDAFNRWVAATVRTFHGFGVGEVRAKEKAPENRSRAYADILFSFVGDEKFFNGYSRKNNCPKKDNPLSSCGLTVRSLWLLMGARHSLLNPEYEIGTVMTYLRAFSIVSGAFSGDPLGCLWSAEGRKKITKEEADRGRVNTPKLTWETFKPKAGDTIFINHPGQHVSTIVEVLEHSDTCVTYISCDGGQVVVEGDKNCCAIRLVKRKAQRIPNTNKIQDIFMTTREVTGWSQVKKLPLPAKVITPFRNSARLALPDPKALGL